MGALKAIEELPMFMPDEAHKINDPSPQHHCF
jgi:hypothetical protein